MTIITSVYASHSQQMPQQVLIEFFQGAQPHIGSIGEYIQEQYKPGHLARANIVVLNDLAASKQARPENTRSQGCLS